MDPNLNLFSRSPNLKYPEGYENWPLAKKELFLEATGMVDGLRIGIEDWAKYSLEGTDGEKEPLTPKNYIKTMIGMNALTPENVEKVEMAFGILASQGLVTENNGVYEVKNISKVSGVVSPETIIQSSPQEHITSAMDQDGNQLIVGSKVDFGSEKGEIVSFENSILGVRAVIKPFNDPNGEFKILVNTLHTIPDISEPPPIVNQIPEPPPVITPEPPPVVEQEKTFEEEWKEFENLRNDLAKTEALKLDYSSLNGISIEDLRAKYGSEKERMAGLIRKREYAKLNTEGPLTKDDEKHFNDYLFEKLVKKENDAYLNAIKANREKTWKDTAKEGLRYALGTKALQWYLKQNKWVRLGLTTAIATGVGYGVGAVAAAGAVGYAGSRVFRGALSFGAAGSVNKFLQKEDSWLSLEAGERLKKQKIEDLKNSNSSFEEKSKKLAEIEKDFEKKRKRKALMKNVLVVGAGASAGLLAGLTEHLYSGSSGSAVIEKNQKIQSQSGLDTSKTTPNPRIVEPAMPEPVAPKAEVAADAGQTETEVAKTVETPIVPLEFMVHEVRSGDSVWKLLEQTLDNNEKFKVMSEAQKTYVLSNLTGKMLGSPATYGFKPGGGVEIGYKLDFTEAFDDNKEIESLFEKAKQTIGEGSKQEDLIVRNNGKILKFLEDHPNEPLTEGTVTKILNTKPKVEFASIKTDPLLVIEKDLAELIKSNNLSPESIEKLIKIGEEGKVLRARILEFEKTDQSAPDFDRNTFLAEKLKLEEEMTKIEGKMADIIEENKKPNTPYESGEVGTDLQRRVEAEMADEIAKAKKGFPVPESSPRPTGLRTMSSDVATFNNNVEVAFLNEIDDIYGKKGILGIGRVLGVDTKEWGEMKSLSANKVLEYFKNPGLPNDLPSQVLQNLQTSEQHRHLIEQVSGLIDQAYQKSKIELKPFENENMEAFIKRLGAFLMKQPNK